MIRPQLLIVTVLVNIVTFFVVIQLLYLHLPVVPLTCSCEDVHTLRRVEEFHPNCSEYGGRARSFPRRIVDAFLMNQETDILLLRLLELASVVDRFVLLESPVSFAPGEHRMGYERVKECWKELAFPILHTTYDALDTNGSDAWERERKIRDYLGRVSRMYASGDAYVLISDVDEIPSNELVSVLRSCDFEKSLSMSRVIMPMFYYSFRYQQLHQGRATAWLGTTIMTTEDLRTLSAQDTRSSEKVFGISHEDTFRNGVHASSFLSAKGLQEKLRSFSHQEFNTEELTSITWLERARTEGIDFIKRPEYTYQRIQCESDPRLPRALARNRDFFLAKQFCQ